MAGDLQNQLQDLCVKTRLVGEKYRHIKTAYDQSREEISDLKAQILARDKEIEQLKLKVEYLSIASTVRLSADNLAATKAMVADLVREIDNCLADLKE